MASALGGYASTIDAPFAHGPLEPRRGVKYALVTPVGDELRLRALVRRSRHSPCYDADACAYCQQGADHRAPDWDCGCGFYAVADDTQLREVMGAYRQPHWARLEVELFGRVIEHERGWRASRQVTLSAAWPNVCRRCSGPASGFTRGDTVDGPALSPCCPACGGGGFLPIVQVIEQLGIEVRLTPPAPGELVPTERLRPGRAPRWQGWAGRARRRRLAARGLAAAALAAVLAGAAWASRGADKPRSPDEALLAELAPLIEASDPAATSARAAARFDPQRRSFAVLARDAIGPDGRPASERTWGVMVWEPPTRKCRVVVVDGRAQSYAWTVAERPAADREGCLAEALAAGAPHVAAPPTEQTAESG